MLRIQNVRLRFIAGRFSRVSIRYDAAIPCCPQPWHHRYHGPDRIYRTAAGTTVETRGVLGLTRTDHGTTTVDYTYDPAGVLLARHTATDDDYGLRYYQPDHARWTQPDPTGSKPIHTSTPPRTLAARPTQPALFLSRKSRIRLAILVQG